MNITTEILKIPVFLLVTYFLFLLLTKSCDSINYSNCVSYRHGAVNVETIKTCEAILK